jgi:hypothetical protein
MNGKRLFDTSKTEASRSITIICLRVGRGARNAALIYSLIETCKMNGVRSVNYIAETLRKLTGGETDYKALLPVYYAK